MGKRILIINKKIRNSVGYMHPTTSAQDRIVINYFMRQAKEGEIHESGTVSGGGGTAYKLENDYHWRNNNCCTQSALGLEQIGLNWIGDMYRPNQTYDKLENKFKPRRLRRTEYKIWP